MVMSRPKVLMILILAFIACLLLFYFIPSNVEDEQEIDPMQDEVCFLLEHARFR